MSLHLSSISDSEEFSRLYSGASEGLHMIIYVHKLSFIALSIFLLHPWVKEETLSIHVHFYSGALWFCPAKPGASICAVSDTFSHRSGCGKATDWRECVNGYMCVWNNTLRLSSAHTDSVPSPAVPPDSHILTATFLQSGAWRQPCRMPAPIAKHRRGGQSTHHYAETNRPSNKTRHPQHGFWMLNCPTGNWTHFILFLQCDGLTQILLVSDFQNKRHQQSMPFVLPL